MWWIWVVVPVMLIVGLLTAVGQFRVGLRGIRHKKAQGKKWYQPDEPGYDPWMKD